jgi:perosamine synthetase
MQKKIAWWTPEVGSKEEHRLVAKVLSDNYPNQGPVTRELEAQIAELLKVKYVSMTTSGTAALFLALRAAGVRPGDEVIVPDIAFIAAGNAVDLCGAKVVLVDVDPKTLTLSPSAFKKAITKKTKAVIPVHISGRGASMRSIKSIARKAGAAVVEDAAEAFMSKHEGTYLGTIGDVGCFSLAGNKTITSGQGGFVVTNNKQIYEQIKFLKNQGVTGVPTGGDDTHPVVGYNFKYTDLQAALALGQLSRLQKRLSRMKHTHELYKKGLRGISGLYVFPFDTDKGEVPQWTDVLVERRDELEEYLRQKNIECRKFWFPMHKHVPYKQPEGRFPISTKLNPKALWLPSAFTLTDKEVRYVVAEIKKFFEN